MEGRARARVAAVPRGQGHGSTLGQVRRGERRGRGSGWRKDTPCTREAHVPSNHKAGRVPSTHALPETRVFPRPCLSCPVPTWRLVGRTLSEKQENEKAKEPSPPLLRPAAPSRQAPPHAQLPPRNQTLLPASPTSTLSTARPVGSPPTPHVQLPPLPARATLVNGLETHLSGLHLPR